MKLRLSLALIALIGIDVNSFAQVESTISGVASSEPTSFDYKSYQASSFSGPGDGLLVWSITVTDPGTDGNDTVLDTLVIGKGTSNTVSSWATNIRQAALYEGGTRVGEVTVVGETIVFVDLSLYTIVPNNSSVTYDLRLTFETVVSDAEQFQFKVTKAAVDDVIGSSYFVGGDGGGPSSSVIGNANVIQVTASKLAFVESPNSFVRQNVPFSVTLQAQDAFGSVDLASATSVSLSLQTGTGTFSPSPQSLSGGEVTFSNLTYDVTETEISLSASTAGLTSATCTPFECIDGVFLDEFRYVNGSYLTANHWTAYAEAGTNPIQTYSASLSYSGLPSTGKGNAARMPGFGTVGEDVYRTFPAQKGDGNVVYLSFLVYVETATLSGDYFIHLSPSGAIGSTSQRYARVFAKFITGVDFYFGVSKNSSTAVLDSTIRTFNDTYHVVVRYEFKPGANNDSVALFVNPNLDGPEPSPAIATTGGLDADADSLDAVGLRQGGIATAPGVIVDGIRIGNEWASTPLPVQMTSFNVFAGTLKAVLTWSTSTETDNAGFEVERRSISDFGPSTSLGASLSSVDYRKVGFVPGAGTSTSPREYAYTDANLAPGRYAYRLKQVDRDGSSTYFREAEVEVGLTAKAFTLNEAFPNPFNPSTSIDFSLADAGVASVRIYDVLGREVATVFNGAAEAGRLYRATWDASSMPSGMYFARLESGGSSAMKRLMLVK